jgi:hypothetical protein
VIVTINRNKRERRIDMDKLTLRRLVATVACLVLALALTSVGPVRAAPAAPLPKIMSAADFAALCNTNLGFTISVNTLVTGGSGTINPYACQVHVAPFVNLTFDQVSLDSPKGSNVGLLVDGGEGSQVHVHQSTMVMDGGLFLEPGGMSPAASTRTVRSSRLRSRRSAARPLVARCAC